MEPGIAAAVPRTWTRTDPIQRSTASAVIKKSAPKSRFKCVSSLSSSSSSSISASSSSTEKMAPSSGAPPLSSGAPPSLGKWACHKCTFLNRAAIAVCSMCKSPWQAPIVSPISATTLAFPIPVPRGFKVVGQDDDKVWRCEKDGGEDNQPLSSFRHCLLNVPSSQSASSLFSTASESRNFRSRNSSTTPTNGVSTASSIGANTCTGNTLFAMGGGIVIEELDVKHDEIDGFGICAFDSEF